MTLPEEKLTQLSMWPQIEAKYQKWLRFMEEQVSFSLEGSSIHTRGHCVRVLLYALEIGAELGLDAQDMDALGAAAAFHDSRRQDDWLDTGHGQRSADYYRTFCRQNALTFDERVYPVIAYHDRDDVSGKQVIEAQGLKNGLLLYDIFKDADGLDRFRLSPGALDVNMLRTRAAKSLVAFAKELVAATAGEKRISDASGYLIVVDVQNDFVTGSLGTPEAQQIVSPLCEKVKSFPGQVIWTLDTHQEDYADTQEGKLLPVKHCIQNTEGWKPVPPLAALQPVVEPWLYAKPTFASIKLAQDLLEIHQHDPIREIELVGLCTDICVVSNALLLKAYLPEVLLVVDEACCAGVTPEKHEAALQTMESCQIKVLRRKNHDPV